MKVCERCFTQLQPGINCGEDQSVCDDCWDDWNDLIDTDANDVLEQAMLLLSWINKKDLGANEVGKGGKR